MKCTDKLCKIFLKAAIIIFIVRLLLLFVDSHFNDWDVIALVIVFVLVIQKLLLTSLFIPTKFKKRRDNIFLALSSFIYIVAIPILVQEAKIPGGDMRGLATFLISFLLIFPIILIVFIPWLFWFIIQCFKFRKKAYIDNFKSFWITITLFVYVIIHWIIAMWPG
ncbi:MAG: hypothetical protein PF574_04900 [Candidatus Delongbacteria bacterium]|jgi:hypothetical protein|nr:hypothetical protein [Candidatus Delongbacteria bacterium]